MNEWTPSQTCPGHREKTIPRGAATIIVRRPILGDEERTKIEQHVQGVLGCVMRDHLKRKEVNHGR